MRRLLSVAFLTLVWITAFEGVASAHAGFVSSNPEPGSELGSAPGVVTLNFSEPLNTKLSRASVATPEGVRVEGKVRSSEEITIQLFTNVQGVYAVSWTTVSLVDGHTLSGDFRFGVGVSPGAGAEGGTNDEPTGSGVLIAVGRLLEDTSLLLLLGLLLLGRLERRDPALTWVRTPIVLTFVSALAGGIAVVLGEALVAAPSSSGSAILTYLTTGLPGWARLGRVVLEGLGLLAAWRWPPARAPLAVGAVVALAAAGHAAAIQPRDWGVTVEAVHLLSAGVWAGGILALALQRAPGGLLGENGRMLLDRFTPPALAAFAATVSTGLVRALQEVGSWTGLLHSSYGVVLLVKVFLVILMFQLSVFGWRRLAVFPKGEAVAAILAIGAAALLSAFPLPPARQAEAAEEASPGSAAVSPIPSGAGLTLGSHAGSVLVGLTVEPARPGANEMTIYVLSLDGPGATAVLPVRASVDGGQVALTQCADSCRKGTMSLHGGERVAIDVGTLAGGRATFRLPHLPVAPGNQVLARMGARMGALTRYRLDEDLTSGLGTTVRSTYAFAAPSSFESHVVEAGSSFSTVWIRDTRYTREGGGMWKVERGGPSVSVPTYIWDSFGPYRDVQILGSARVDGVHTTELTFAGGGQDLPIWFRLWVDGEGYVHRAEMRAPGHFMDHRYYDFDAPITIQPPKGTSR
jgi:copper transport protein